MKIVRKALSIVVASILSIALYTAVMIWNEAMDEGCISNIIKKHGDECRRYL